MPTVLVCFGDIKCMKLCVKPKQIGAEIKQGTPRGKKEDSIDGIVSVTTGDSLV